MPQPVLVQPSDKAKQAYGQTAASGMDLDRAFDYIKSYEGFKPEPYKDTKGKWTIGIGTLIGTGTDEDLAKSGYKGKSIDLNTAAQIAREDIAKKAAKMSNPDYLGRIVQQFSPELQTGLVSGFYRGDVSGSPKTLKLLNSGDLIGAAKEFLDSDEYRKAKQEGSGVAGRMQDLANLIASEGDRNPQFYQTFSSRVESQLKNPAQQKLP